MKLKVLLGIIRDECFCSMAKYNSSTQIGISEVERKETIR